MPAHRDEGRALGALTPIQAAAPIAILDFLANAESVVQRLGQHTCVSDWVLVRCLGDEWVVLAMLTSVLGLDLDRSRLQRRLDAAESAALSDPMTGLGNRRAFERAVHQEEARCARFGHRAGIMVLDLDGLKDVNDTWGHAAGDELLRRAGESIRMTLRSTDQAFRIGGDEFALVLPEVTSDGLDGLHERLVDALAGAGVSASIGSAIRENAGSLHASVRAADAEMYERKRGRVASRRQDLKA